MIFIEKIDNLSPDIAEPLVENAALEALRHQSAPEDGEVAIILTDDTQLHELNK